MKNLFKNLMLVAVAAMAFTACTETNDEVNAVSKKTVIKGVATINNNGDDTRSAFGDRVEDENGNFYYESNWEGNESIKIFIDGLNEPVITDIDKDGHFEVEVDGEFDSGTAIYVCSPAEAWDSQWSPNIKAVQTPLANSVDPGVHVLQSQGATIASSVVTMSLQNACFGKMTVNTPSEFVIDHVELELNGLKYNSYEDTMSYTINADNVEGNTFWFALEAPMTVSSFTVTAYDANKNAYTKTSTIPEGRSLIFEWKKVSTFSVSNLNAVVEPEPEPTPDPSTAPKFAGAKLYQSYGGTDKKIQLTGDGEVLHDLIFNLMGNPAYTYVSADSTYLNAGTYDTDYGKDSVIDPGYSTYNNMAIDDIKVTVEHVDEGYYIVVENVVMDGNVVIPMATYTGLIDGFSAPWASVGNEPDQPSGDVIELTITEHATIFRQGPEHELGFYYATGKMVDIDFLANPIVPGTYTLATGLSGMYCKSHGASMQECEVVVTDAGDGKLTFDATFKVNDQRYHFTYTAKIYA